MSNYDLIQKVATDIFYISVGISALLGLGCGLSFWYKVLRG